jgi:glycosyltransferase involved in cell wall biosynthesis
VKTIFSVTYHHSKKIRPNGASFLSRYLETLIESTKFDLGIVIVDNQSEINLYNQIKNIPEVLDYVRIEDQSVNGLTGAWNVGIRRSSELGDIIINTNEDLIFDQTINNFVSEIINDEKRHCSIYGPLTNGVPELAHPHQFSNGPINEKMKTLTSVDLNKERPGKGGWSEVLNGFFLGFTKDFYDTFNIDGELFPISHKNNRGDGKWGGQEGIMIEWAEKGGMCKVIQTCWINHAKIRSYRKARHLYGDGPL